MCGDIIFLIELLKKNKFKNLLIIVQIVNEKTKYEKRYCIF